MSARRIIMAVLFAAAALAGAMPAQASGSGLCKVADNGILHVGVAVSEGDACSQDCPSTINVNVAVTVGGDIHQCSGSNGPMTLQTQTAPCDVLHGPWQAPCEQLIWNSGTVLHCLVSPTWSLIPPCVDEAGPLQPLPLR